ncbi:uncharacterized protein LOC121382013 [Gigantopelta aegis]|uniref:uncharacterized protein LOC121382013 n=1 Tax=Gigantopelta aegis TaxID=1735272 RepID=UPI001B88901B|nr:uncharacterized protein LOC121382013 [Gigantopelta aegis]
MLHLPLKMNKNCFLLGYKARENIVGFVAFSEYNECFMNDKPLPKERSIPIKYRDFYFKEEYTSASDTYLLGICQKADIPPITKEQIGYVEEVTRGQASSLDWHNQRNGRITGSVAHAFLRTDPNHPAQSLIYKACSTSTVQINTAAISWGKEHENDAYVLYESINDSRFQVDNKISGHILPLSRGVHTNFHVRKCGFMISDELPFLGASPDGLCCCDCCGQGVLEIKCPYKFRNIDFDNAAKDPYCCITADYKLKVNHSYYTQCQFQMFVANASYCDFVFWTPVDVVVTRISIDNDFVSTMKSRLEAVWRGGILPELLSRKMELLSNEKENTDSNIKNLTTYCICKTETESEDMVACDKCDQWFHISCIGLKRVPRTATWFCKDCRKLRKSTQ